MDVLDTSTLNAEESLCKGHEEEVYLLCATESTSLVGGDQQENKAKIEGRVDS